MHLTEVKLNTATHELFVGDRVCRCDVLVVDGVQIAVEALTLMTNPRRDSLLGFVRKGQVLEVTSLQVLSLDGDVIPEKVLDASSFLSERLKESSGGH